MEMGDGLVPYKGMSRPSRRNRVGKMLSTDLQDYSVKKLAKKEQSEAEAKFIDFALCEVDQMVQRQAPSELGKTLRTIVHRLKESVSGCLTCCDTDRILAIANFGYMCVDPEISEYLSRFLQLLVSHQHGSIPDALVTEPFCSYIIQCLTPTFPNVQGAAVDLINALSAVPDLDCSVFFPAYRSIFSFSTMENLAFYIWHQLRYLPVDADLFGLITHILGSGNWGAAGKILKGVLAPLAEGFTPLVEYFLTPESLAYLSSLMHAQQFSDQPELGFLVYGRLLPWADATIVESFTDLDLIRVRLFENGASQDRTHLAILTFLRQLIDCHPGIVQVLVDEFSEQSRLGIVDALIALQNSDMFSIRERVLKVLCSLIKRTSASQMRQLSPNLILDFLCTMLPNVAERTARTVLWCIMRMSHVFIEPEDNFQELFLAHDGPEVVQSLFESAGPEVAMEAQRVLNHLFVDE
jgi:hypothetical protein